MDKSMASLTPSSSTVTSLDEPWIMAPFFVDSPYGYGTGGSGHWFWTFATGPGCATLS